MTTSMLSAWQSGHTVGAFTLGRSLGMGMQTLVFEARRGGETFVIKTPRSSDVDLDERRRFLQEAAALATIAHPSIVKVLELSEAEDRPYMIMEYVSDRTLATEIREGVLGEADAVRVALALADALAELHDRGFVHRDVKPRNVLMRNRGAPVLIDLGLAVRARSSSEHKEIAGTFAYAAPEQTGMLSRPVDGRADLYALGVLLYEAVSGALPFTSADAADLIRMHAVQAVPELKADVSARFREVLKRLMAKDPDDRFASASALAAELRDAFGASISELTPKLAGVEAKLVGRASELLALSPLLETRMASPRGLLLEGASGIGKSRLLAEMSARASRAGFEVSHAACAQGSGAALRPIRAWFAELAERWTALGETKPDVLEKRRAAIREAAQHAPQLIGTLIPEISQWLGPASEPSAFEENYVELVATFIVSVAAALGAEAPLCLVLEDAQWLDDATTDVLATALSAKKTPLLVLIAGRELPEARRRKLREALVHVPVGPLADDALAEIVRAELSSRTLTNEACAVLVRRAAGNPRFAQQTVHTLLDLGLLRPTWTAWVLDEAALASVDLPNDAASLQLERLGRLRVATRDALTLAAVVGPRFREDVLQAAWEQRGRDRAELLRAIEVGLSERLIEPADRGGTRRRYAFVHDRIPEVLATSLSPEALAELHLAAAKALADAPRDPDDVFELAEHYLAAAAKSKEAHEALVSAGLRASDTYAFADAHRFLTHALAIAEKVEDPLALRLGLGLVCTRLGRIEEGIAEFQKALEHAPEAATRAELHHLIARAHFTDFETKRTWESLKTAFAEMGETLEPWLPIAVLRALVAVVVTVALGWTGGKLTSERAKKRHRLRARLHETAAITAYFNMEPIRNLTINLCGFTSAVRLGPVEEHVTFFANASAGFGDARLSGVASFLSRRATELAIASHSPGAQAKAAAYEAHSMHFAGATPDSARRAEELLEKALDRHGDVMDHLDFGLACGDQIWNLWIRGYSAAALAVGARLTRRANTANDPLVVHSAANMLMAGVYSSLGRLDEADQVLAEGRALLKARPDQAYRRALVIGVQLATWIEHRGDIAEVDELMKEWRTIGLLPEVTPLHLRMVYVFHAKARLDHAARTGATTFDDALEGALKSLSRMQPTPTLECHRRVIFAVAARLRGDREQAEIELTAAERLARDADSPWVLAEVMKERAAHHLEQGDLRIARRTAEQARGLANASKLIALAKRITASFDLGSDDPSSGAVITISSDSVSGGVEVSSTGATVFRAASTVGVEVVQLRRRLSVLTELVSASATITEPDEVARVGLRQAVHTLGAERGALLMGPSATDLKLRFACDSNGEFAQESWSYSTTAVERAGTERRALVFSGNDDGALLGSESAVALGIRSILVAPIAWGDELIGVMYLDSRIAKGVFRADDTEMLSALGAQIAASITNARHASSEAERRALQRDLELTAAVQALFLPAEATLTSERLKLTGYYRPASKCGGDWWWYERRDGSLHVLVGDVTGHGAASAMVAASAATFFRAQRRRSGSGALQPALLELNEDLRELARGEFAMAAACLSVNETTLELEGLAAGAPPALLLDNGAVRVLSAPGQPLGSGDDPSLGSLKRTLAPGQRLWLFTDGLPELLLASGRQLGWRRLSSMLQKTNGLSHEEATKSLAEQLDVLRKEPRPSDTEDDMTFVLLDVIA
jgi:serine phosphatase RsbU (regulator of sigma subunit)/tetratricopeptide (TPR) repeat protein